MGMVTGAMVTTLGFGGVASAADLSFRGAFTQDDEVQLFNFSLRTDSQVTVRTYSYGGGTQSDGTVIAAGGFDPVLSLFNETGRFIAISDDDASGTVATDPSTGQGYDALIDVMLAAGDYTLALTQFDNFPSGANLEDGFKHDGEGNFTNDFTRCETDSSFCDFLGDVRTSQWAFDTSGFLPLLEADEEKPPVDEPGPQPTEVPEPTATVAMALAGMLAMAKRRRSQ